MAELQAQTQYGPDSPAVTPTAISQTAFEKGGEQGFGLTTALQFQVHLLVPYSSSTLKEIRQLERKKV